MILNQVQGLCKSLALLYLEPEPLTCQVKNILVKLATCHHSVTVWAPLVHHGSTVSNRFSNRFKRRASTMNASLPSIYKAFVGLCAQQLCRTACPTVHALKTSHLNDSDCYQPRPTGCSAEQGARRSRHTSCATTRAAFCTSTAMHHRPSCCASAHVKHTHEAPGTSACVQLSNSQGIQTACPLTHHC